MGTSFASFTDGALRFSNLRASEVGAGGVNSALADVSFAPRPTVPGVTDGLVWGGFVAGVVGTGAGGGASTLTLRLSYDVSAISSFALVNAIRANSIAVDTAFPPGVGASITAVQAVRDLSGNLLAQSTLIRDASNTDTADPPIELVQGDDLTWVGGFGTVSVSVDLTFTLGPDTPTNIAFTISGATQVFGTAPAVALGDLVWEDLDADGVRDAGEAGIAGATVQLLGANGAQIDSTTTGADGSYAFVSKPPGTYSVRFVTPGGGFEASPANQGGNDALDSDAVGGVTQQVTLAGGQADITLDAGFFRRASLGDLVFLDANANGVQDGGDAGLGGVRVELFDAGGVFQRFTTTASDGSYAFTGLRPGDYSVRFVAPEGFALTSALQGGNPALDSDAGPGGFSQAVNLVSGEHDGTIDAGLVRLVPRISIDKVTNGLDGPVLLRDADVTWTYTVTNTGPVALSDVAVADSDPALTVRFVSGDADGDGRLDTTETWLFEATGRATAASYANTGTVQARFVDGLGNATAVSDADGSSYTTLVPGISIAKLTNGVDGLVVLRGSAVTWTYEVRNTGTVELSDVTVTDDRETGLVFAGGDADADGRLDTTEVWRFEKAGTATEASYANIGTARGTASDASGNTRAVEASDPSSYITVQPGIAIEKVTNGTDGPVLLRDGQVTWTYTVRNTGDLALSDVAVTDDREGAVTNFVGGDANGNSLLDRGEVWTFTKTGTASAASYTNIGTATGRGTDAFRNFRDVAAADSSSYTTVVPAISIAKLTEGVDGAVLFEGAAITWTYAVTNTGGIDLRDVAVADDQEGAVTAFAGDDGDSVLEVGETWTFTKTGVADAASYTNIGTVTATARDGFGNSRNVTASDPSSYRTIAPGIEIEKVTNGTDGPALLDGTPVTWTYTVRNTGNVDLTGVAVTDDREGAVTNLVSGDDGDRVLEVGEAWVFALAGVAGATPYTNRGTVVGTATDGFGNTREVRDLDDSSYTPVLPGVSIIKLTNGLDGLALLRDAALVWSYEVRNTGNVELSAIAVSDDREGAITNLVSGDADGDGRLDLGEVWRFEKAGTASDAAYANIGTVSGTATDSQGNTRRVEAADGSSYRTVQPGIEITKVTNGVDGPVLLRDGQVTWTYTVRNTGDLALSNVAVTDDVEGAVTNLVSGDANNNRLLDLGEVWTFTKSGVASAAAYANTGEVTATGTDAFGNARGVSDTDPSSYITVVPSISISKLTNGVDGAVLLLGSAVTWTYEVANTGAIALRDVRVTDDREGAVTAFSGDAGNDGVLSVGEVWTFTKAGIASAASYTNIGTAVATARDGFGNSLDVVAADGSSYTTFALGTIGDEVFFDRDGDGVRDAGEGLAGVTVRLDIGNNGSFERTAVTDAEGRYTFGGLGAGTYAVVVDTSTLPGGGAGYQNTADPDGGASSRSVVALGAGQSNLLQDFGYRAFDFGDAPATYGTLLAANGPRHVLSTGQSAATPALFLGASVDAEADGQPNAAATGDDLGAPGDDENGVTFLSAVQAGQTAQIRVNVTEAAGVNGRLNAWIDFNRDGDFADAGERVLFDRAVAPGDQVFDIAVPVSASVGATHARFRLSTDAAAQSATGLALDGEVEDYALTIAAAPVARLDIEKTTNGPTNRNPLAPDFNNEDAANGAGVPILTVGSAVTWTYQVTNTGTTAFTRAQVSIVDDDGTPTNAADDMTTANGRIAFHREVAGDGDALLEANEVWEYRATGVVESTAALGAPVTLNLAGSTAMSGALGNAFTVGAGGISARVTGFARDKHTGAWTDAYVGRFGGGMGVTDGSEGSGAGAAHTVDNVGARDNYALFRFNQNVVVDSAFLGYVVHDSDLRVWIGTAANAFDTNIRLTDAFLAGLGFTEVNETTLTTARLANLNAGGVSGNVLVIAANTGETKAEDNFKIETLRVQAAGTGVYSNTATVSAPGAVGDSDMSHYRGVPALVARLDIEKTTNGSSNRNHVAPDFNNEDAANGAGVPVLVAGTDVTWTYRVTNTGEAAFARAQVSIVDDDGTPTNAADDMTTANGRIAFHRVVTGDSDDLLEANEVWEYRATGTVENLASLSTPVSIVMEGSSALDGADGNARHFSAGGVNVQATAFARDKHTGHWSQAYLGTFGGGLGVNDSGEGNGDNNRHTVDNTGGRDNYVLFRFDQSVVVDSAHLGYVVGDSDLRVWIGTVGNAFSTNIQLTDAVLHGLGFTELNDTSATGARTADFNAAGRAGNVLVIAASPDDTTPEDFFKIEKLNLLAAGPGLYKNVATVSAPGATGDSDASHYRSVAATPRLDVEKLVSVDNGRTWHDADSPAGPTANAGGAVQFKFVVTNTGNVALGNIVLSDDVLDLNGSAAGRSITINSLAASNPGHSDTQEFVVHATAQVGQHANTATVTATFNGAAVTDTDMAHYFGAAGPGVRTPGFWTNDKWRDLWDGDSGVPSQAGQPGFPGRDILFAAPTPVDPVTGRATTGLLIGDFNRDGRTNNGEHTIFYTVGEALSVMTGSSGHDARFILDRALVATWLNHLAGNPLEAASPTAFDARDAVSHAIAWLQRETPDENHDGRGDGNLWLNPSHWRVASSSTDWNNTVGGIPAGNRIKDWLDGYNNFGTVTNDGVTVRIAADGDMF